MPRSGRRRQMMIPLPKIPRLPRPACTARCGGGCRAAPGLAAAIVAMATAVVLAALLIALRGPILAALPASAGFYAGFGLLPDPLGGAGH